MTRRKELRMERKAAKVENKRSKAQSRLELAKQGIVTPSAADGIGKSLGAVSAAVGSIMGGPAAALANAMQPQQEAPQQAYTPPPTYTPPYVPDNNNVSLGQASKAVQQVMEQVADTTASPATGKNKSAASEDDKNKNLPWIIGGVIAFLLIIFLLFKK
jgi:hypothetical protein